ncbi:MAG: phosphate-starvation-inducible PsiE family protein [Acidimicrobiales bacterium]
MASPSTPGRRSAEGAGQAHRSGVGMLHLGVTVLQAAVAVSLLIVAGVVLVRTLVTFLDQPASYPTSLISALDGILVVIIIVDILHTVVTHLRDTRVPVKPFLVIGVLAGIRDVLSASARLELTGHQSSIDFSQSVIELGVGVGVVVVLLAGLVVLRVAADSSETGPEI